MADLEIRNVSAEGGPTVGATRRPRQSRDAFGRFAARKTTEVGPLGPAGGVGESGVDSVSGRFIPGVRINSVLHDPIDPQRVHEVGPSRAPFIEAEHEQNREAEHAVNHAMGCRTCATGGAL